MVEEKQPSDQKSPEQPGAPSTNSDWRSMRHEEREKRRAEHHAAREARRTARAPFYGWSAGAVLILVGILMFLQNVNMDYLTNWWVLFILIPAIGAFATAWNLYSSAGYLTAPARGSLIGGIVLTMIAAIALLNLNWGLVGPILLILAGVALLLNVMLPG